jgi:hypothetical protein
MTQSKISQLLLVANAVILLLVTTFFLNTQSFHIAHQRIGTHHRTVAIKLLEGDDDFEDDFMDGVDEKLNERFPIKRADTQRRQKGRAVFSGLKNREGLNRAVAAGLFIAGIGAGEMSEASHLSKCLVNSADIFVL